MRWGAKLHAPPATPERAETPSTGPVRWTLLGFFAIQFPYEDWGLNSSTWQVTRVSPTPTHGLCQRVDAGDGREVAELNYIHRYFLAALNTARCLGRCQVNQVVEELKCSAHIALAKCKSKLQVSDGTASDYCVLLFPVVSLCLFLAFSVVCFFVAVCSGDGQTRM